MTTPGEAIIDAVCRAKALDSAIVEEHGTIWAWAGNAPEQIEAALHAAGWEIRRLPQGDEAPKQEGWQTIESAPDIGKRTMLVWCAEDRNTYTAYREDGIWFHAAAGNRRMMEIPTHWRALPANPEEHEP